MTGPTGRTTPFSRRLAAALRDAWLWSRDIGALDERGYLTLKDRLKDMVISGGTNIYPREIDEVLLRHAEVLACSVFGRRHVMPAQAGTHDFPDLTGM